MPNQYRRDSDEVTILFALRHPFTDLSVTKIQGDRLDVGIDINGEYAGRIRINQEDAPAVMVQCFAEGRRPIGTMIGRKVLWSVDARQLALHQSVIDDSGNIHEIRTLVDG